MKMRNSVFLVARKFWISPILALIPVLGLATSLFVATAQALDLFPPNVPVVLGPSTIRPQTWDRGDPGTTSAEWIFATAPDPTTPLAPDGIDVPLNPGDYNGTDVTTGNPITGPVATPSEGLGIGAGGSGWLNTSDSDATITFTIPDWVDDNPIKYLQVQTLFTEPPGSTRNPDLSVTGYKDNSPIDANDDGPPIGKIGHLRIGRERQRRARCREPLHVVDLAIGGAASMKQLAIPRRLADVVVARLLARRVPRATDLIGLAEHV